MEKLEVIEMLLDLSEKQLDYVLAHIEYIMKGESKDV